jgi:hypothetical protein
MTTDGVEVGVIIEDAVVMTDGAVTADSRQQKAAHKAPLFVPAINPMG